METMGVSVNSQDESSTPLAAMPLLPECDMHEVKASLDIGTMDTADSRDQPEVSRDGGANISDASGNEQATTKKRKSRDDLFPAADPAALHTKRAKLGDGEHDQPLSHYEIPADRSHLPAEMWHRIFTFCPPRTLGNLLCTNKLFNSYLDPSSTVTVANRPPPLSHSLVKPLKPNAIWRDARRVFWPNTPGPLSGKTELDMWRLVCSPSCQFCRNRGARPPAMHDPLHAGPGADGVACIWSFRVRCCGPCLLSKSMKEMDFFMSDVPTFLMPALPFIFLTQDQDAIAPSTIERGQLSALPALVKLFWTSDVESLRREFLSAKELGAPAVEEWQKGLSSRGHDQRAEAAKWEKFTDSGGVIAMRTVLHPGYQPSAPILEGGEAPAVHPPSNLHAKASPGPTLSTQAPSRSPVHASQCEQTTAAVATPTNSDPLPLPAGVELTKSEVERLKATKKTEIERRAKLLDPSLTMAVLEHTSAFRAAIQILKPLDDSTWEMLKPRLLAQKAEAEKQLSRKPAELPEKPGSVAQKTDVQPEKTKEDIDAEWDEIQGPVRLKILKYADEVTRDWDDGEKVTKDNAASFAVDVLLHVRKRFYTEAKKEAAAAHAAGREPVIDPPQGPFTQKLTLENMKYVFDVKVRPLTEPLRKELFICNGCDFNPKAFGFEGVIQHYAAKHTTALSQGNIVVHWRAEWPANPPFKASSRPSKRAFHSLPAVPPLPAGSNNNNNIINTSSAAPRYGYGSIPSAAFSVAPHPPLPPPPPPPPPPAESYLMGGQGQQAYGPSMYGAEPFPSAPQNPYPPPAAFPPVAQGHGQPAFQPPAQPGQYPPYPHQTPGIGYSGTTPAHQAYTGTAPGHAEAHKAVPPLAAPSDSYSFKLEKMATRAREIWLATSDLKDFPGAIRIFTVIQHLDKFFQSWFGERLPFALFTDGLANHKEMRPVRNINGLPCKTCYNGIGKAFLSENDKRQYSLPQLVNHFKKMHSSASPDDGPQGMPAFNWLTDMLRVPHTTALKNMAGRKHPMLLEAVELVMKRLKESQPPPQPSLKQGWKKDAEKPKNQNPSVDSHGHFYSAPIPGVAPQEQSNNAFHYSGTQAMPKKNDRKSRNGKGAPGRREEMTDMIHDMRAADRVQTAQAQPAPVAPSSTSHMINPVAGGGGVSSKPQKPAYVPPRKRGVAIKGERQEDVDLRRVPEAPRQPEERDLLGALEMHLTHAEEQPASQRRAEPLQEPQARAIYVDDRGREATHHERSFREPEHYVRYVEGSSHGAIRSEPGHGRPRSPGYVRYAEPPPPPPPVAEPQRSRYAGVPVYGARPAPVPRQPEYYRVYADDVRPSRPVASYESYELVHVVHPDGDYYVRQVRREGTEPDARYYAAAPYDERAGGSRPVRREGAPPPQPSYGSAYGPHPGGGGSNSWKAAAATSAAPARADSAYFEEYDPRFPAAVPVDGRRQVRYP